MTNIPTASNCSTRDFARVTAILHTYFEGLHQGDVSKLSAVFHDDAWLKSPNSRRSLAQWLTDVAARSTPVQLNQPFAYKILSLDIVQDQAMAKIHCPLFDFNYIDFIGLLKEQGQWRIVTKMYADIKEKNECKP